MRSTSDREQAGICGQPWRHIPEAWDRLFRVRERSGRVAGELWDREGSYDSLIFRFAYEILRARLPDEVF